MNVYIQWFQDWRRLRPRAGGYCAYASKIMAKVFPELRVVKGEVLIPGVGGVTYVRFSEEALQRKHEYPPVWAAHWWCETVDGVILDPTGDQFTEVLEYR